jgi:tetratricopeptide (TPR) repeat protein
MKRPEQHITETKSARIFENIVPDEWVAREIKPDYGVDYIVEIFTNGLSTGKSFFVQLKGSKQEIENDTFKKQFDIVNLDYYASLSLPVLIVCVSVITEQIWCLWSTNLRDAFTLKDKQESLSVSLDKKYLIDKISFLKLETDLDSTKKFGISIRTDGETGVLLNESILKWINHFYPKTISIDFKYLPNHIELNYAQKPIDQLIFTIKAFSFKKEILIESIKEDNIELHRPLFNENDVNDLNKDILKAIAICFAKYDIQGSLLLLRKIIGHVDFSSENGMLSLDPMGLLTLSRNNNELALFNKLIKDIIDLNQYELFFFCDLAYFAVDAESEELQQYRIENLSYLIEKSKDDSVKGTSHYNLGNILKTNLDSNAALFHYFKARKLFPDYLERPYWWREIAGLLFSKGHFKWAEAFYRKSLEKSKTHKPKSYGRLEKKSPKEENLITALIADCLFYQGKFREAHLLFEKYLHETKTRISEWILKNIICVEFVNRDLDSININRKKSLECIEKSFKISSEDEIINCLSDSIKANPLNGLAWFNLGVVLDKKSNFEGALFAFLATSLIQDWDKEAQFNTMTIALTQKNFEVLVAVLQFVIEKHGGLVSNDLADYIMKKNIPLDAKKMLIKTLNEMIEKMKKDV